MWLQVFILFFGVIYASGSLPADQYYRELQCKPVPADSPSRYDCHILDELKSDQCYYNGKHYSIGDSVQRDSLENNCIVECRCDRDHLGKAYFSCVNIECPSLFNPNYEAGCNYLYDQENCCPIKKHCDHKDQPIYTCQYGGKKYKQGERIYPSEKPCLTCLCMEGFNGTLAEPWCKKVSCDMYLHYGNQIRDGCIPTYYKSTDCCPIPEWRCPDESDTIIEQDGTEAVASPKSKEEMCKFGKLQLVTGQMLSPTDKKCVECKCITPPHISCVMNTTCYENQFSSYD